MLKVLLYLRRLPQERYDQMVQAVSLRALERRLTPDDIDELADVLRDRRADDALFDWFLSSPSATAFDVRTRLEQPRSESDSAARGL
jgi:hypothetical protein